MQLWFSRRSAVSLREQLATQLMLTIASGELAPGQRLPSTRDLARRFRLHPNTVSADYKQLSATSGWNFRKGQVRSTLNLRFKVPSPDTGLAESG
jgi:GntR family transcriptional regulator